MELISLSILLFFTFTISILLIVRGVKSSKETLNQLRDW
jgi:hypothetical protein